MRIVPSTAAIARPILTTVLRQAACKRATGASSTIRLSLRGMRAPPSIPAESREPRNDLVTCGRIGCGLDLQSFAARGGDHRPLGNDLARAQKGRGQTGI